MPIRICPQCRGVTEDMVCPSDGFPTVEAAKFGRRPKDALIGTTFENRYRIEQKLGQGGMGAVYKATQLTVDRPVALKVMKKELGDDLKEVARFQQEARAIASLHHPNIISLIDFGQASTGQLFLVMEFIEGEPLNTLLKREAPIEPKRAHRITSQILEALAEAHDSGIVHRDMKPENLFVTQLGRKGDFIKVLDFGIAKVRNDSASEMNLTRTGAIIGSPRYMAPEQARGQTITGQTDIYAVGCILYEMLAGRPVFKAASATDYVIAHVTQPPPPLTVDGAELRGPLVDICLWMLKKKPWERPQGCEAVLRALEECRDRPVTALDDKGFKEIATGPMQEIDPGIPSIPGIEPLELNATQHAAPGTLAGHPPRDLDTSVTRTHGGIPSQALAGATSPGPATTGTQPPKRRWAMMVLGLLLVLGGAGSAYYFGVLQQQPTEVAPTPTQRALAPGAVGQHAGPTVAAAASPSKTSAATTAAPKKTAVPPTPPPSVAPAASEKPASSEPTAQTPKADASPPAEQPPTPTPPSPELREGKKAPPTAPPPAAEKASLPAPVVLQTDEPGLRVFSGERAVGVTPYSVQWATDEDPPKLRVEAPRGYVDTDVEVRVSQRGSTLNVAFKKKRSVRRKTNRRPAKKTPPAPPKPKKKKKEIPLL